MPGRKIEAVAAEELLRPQTDGSIPVLVDVQHPGIVWKDGSGDQENGHLRLINANFPVKYSGHYYMPCVFKFTMPSEDGKKVGSTDITISAIDRRIIEIIRSVSSNPRAVIEAFFTKSGSTVYFSRLYRFEFEMSDCTWDGATARWSLTFDPSMQLNVPRDYASAGRCPGDFTTE